MRPLRLFAAAFVVLTLGACPRPVEEPQPLEITTSALPDGYRGEQYDAAWTATGGVPPYTWTWSGTSIPEGLTLRAGGALSGVPTGAGEFSLAVQVVDSRGATATQTRALRIHPPVSFVTEVLAEAFAQESYEQGIAVTGGLAPLQLTLTSALPEGLSFEGAALRGTPTVSGEFPIAFAVTDANGRAATKSFSLVVRPPLTLEAVSPAHLYVGEPFALPLIASGGAAPYDFTLASGALPDGLSLTTSGALSGTATTPGDYSLVVRATDARSRTATQALTLRVLTPVQLLTATLPDGYRNRPYAELLQAAGGATPYTFTLKSGALPSGLSLTAAGAISGTPTVTTSAATVELQVADAHGRTATIPLTLSVFEVPVISGGSPPDGYLTEAFSHSGAVSGGKAPLSWSLASGALPSGLALSADGVLSGTPDTLGTFFAEVTARDANGVAASASWTIAVHPLPVMGSVAPGDAYVTVAMSHQAQASGGEPPLTWAVTAGDLPPGLTFSSDGVLSGTPTAPGAFPITVTLSDANSRTSSRTWTLRVYALPAVGLEDPPDAYGSESLSWSASVTGGKAPFTWSYDSGALPSDVSFDANGLLSGTPFQTGLWTLQVRVTDANSRSATRTLHLNVYAAPQLVTTSLPDGQVGVAYAEQLSANGGKAPLRYEVVAGALPAGVQLDGLTGAFSGTPDLAETASFTVRVLDANDRADDQALTVTIAPGSAPAVLEVANWNIEWFGSTGLGPADEGLQLQNATGVIADGGFDVVGVAEIVATAQFDALVAGLPGYAGFLANDATVTGGSAAYTASEQKLGFVYDTAKVAVLNREIILAEYDHEFAGRPPLRVDTRVTVGGLTEDITFIMVHLKAQSQSGGAADRDHRAASAAALKDYLDTVLSAANVLVIGDWNDDVDESIYCSGGVCLDTPWRNFLDDATNYTFVTSPLTWAGLQSTVGYDDMIDHHLATNEMNALFYGYPEVVRPDLWPVPVANYGDTTSDHYPILTRYDLSGGGGPPPEPPAQHVFMNEIRYDEPNTSYSAEFIEVRNGGSANADISGWTLSDAQVRHVFAPGTILAPGKVIVVFGGASAIGGTPSAVPASSGSLHLLSPADFIDLKRADGSVVDSFSYSSSPGDGVSMNRSPDGDEAGAWVSHLTLTGTNASAGYRATGASW